MDNQPATNSSRSLLVRLWPWLVVLAVLLFVGFIRVRLLEMPLERDEGEYAYAGQLILQGIPPYELAYNMKLPGTYYAYAAGMAVFGQTIAGVHLTLLLVNALTIIFVFLLGRNLFGITAGLAACASYAIMSVSPAVLGMAAHATHFVVLFAVPATLLLWKARPHQRGILFFSGLLYGLAFLMKQQGIFFGIFGFLVLLWRERSETLSIADSAKRISLYILGAALPFAVVCIYLASAGVFSQFWFWTFSYARTYATSTPLGDGFGYLLDYIRNQFNFFAGFWVLAAAGLVVALRNAADQSRWAFAIGFLFFSFLGVLPGLYFREHYFVLLLPAFALTVGMAVAFLQSMAPRRMKAIPVILLAGVVAWDIYLQRPAFFQLSPQILGQVIYKYNPFIESVSVAEYIREHSSKDARVAVIGSEPEIYFYAGRHSATGYIYTYPLMEDQPYAATMQHRMIKEIELAKPEYLVIAVNRYSWLVTKSSNLEILDWTQKYADTNYDRVGIVDRRLGKPEIQLWDGDARNYHGKLEQYLGVYKHKPPAN
jgi:4-amino-4-deoxy-L-arabinose transferase-like glycosyltransferase